MSEPNIKSSVELKARKTSWRVYAMDSAANWGITLGGLMVIVAVLGMLLFIFSQVVPLFLPADSDEIHASQTTIHVAPVAIKSDEYRRVATIVREDGVCDIVSLANGERISDYQSGALKGAHVGDAWISTRPIGNVTVDGVQNVPKYHMALGSDDGRVVTGSIQYLTRYLRYDVAEEPEELASLARPTRDDFSRVDYVPEVSIRDIKGARSLVEPLEDFGLYRSVQAQVEYEHIVDIDLEGQSIRSIASSASPPGSDNLETVTLIVTERGQVKLISEVFSFNEISEELEVEETSVQDLTEHVRGKAAFATLDEARKRAVVASPEGWVTTFQRASSGVQPSWIVEYGPINVFEAESGVDWERVVQSQRREHGYADAQEPLRLTTIGFALGDISLLCADSHGGLQQWFAVRIEEDKKVFKRIRSFAPAKTAVMDFSVAEKGKSILTSEVDGTLRAIQLTSEKTYFSASTAGTPVTCFPKKSDGVIAIDNGGDLHHWWIDAPHVEVSMDTFFGKVWYEDYEAPAYEWQSSSATDDVEPKMSMIPLLIGTAKGALYAMLFSIPIAILAAVYTSEFMSFRLRNIIKPVMEVMASLPSVVLGFLAALYMAPMAAPNMPAIILFFVLLPVVLFAFGWLWQQMPPAVTGKLGPWRTIILLGVFLGGTALISAKLGPHAEAILFPKTEAAGASVLAQQSLEPHTSQLSQELDTGDFRSWTGGGKPIERAAVQYKYLDEEAGFSIASLDRAEKQLSLASPTPGARGTTADGRPVEVLGILPEGWWIPGGDNLFLAILFIVLLPIVVLGLRCIFVGCGAWGFHVHLWKQKPNQWHPVKAVADFRRRYEGRQSGGLRPVLLDFLIYSFYGIGLCGLTYLLTVMIGPLIESLFFSYDHPTAGSVTDFRRALLGVEGARFELKNSLIVGFAMGFAVIPIIYTISEDSLQAVPNQLRSASLACGASPWQTATRVSLPAALPGIFSAIVIGLGRAVGETMIVVMAAGGTAVNDFDPFKGFRSLSASIAIEMPEAPHGGTLFRALFLAGLLLFAMTFVINTIAEIVRIRLRRKMARV